MGCSRSSEGVLTVDHIAVFSKRKLLGDLNFSIRGGSQILNDRTGTPILADRIFAIIYLPVDQQLKGTEIIPVTVDQKIFADTFVFFVGDLDNRSKFGGNKQTG